MLITFVLRAPQGDVWTMGHNDSRGGGGHGSKPLDASGQLGRDGDRQPGRVKGALLGKTVVQVRLSRYKYWRCKVVRAGSVQFAQFSAV